MRTFGGTPSDVVASVSSGRPVPGAQLTVWTDPAGTQITALQDTDGNMLPGYVTADEVGAFTFVIDSDTYSIVWVQDTNTRWWECIAREIITELVEAYEELPELVEAAEAAVEAVESITPVDAKAAGLIPDSTPDASANTKLLNSLLTKSNVYVPAGMYWVSDSIRIPSYRSLTGAGIGQTEFKIIDGADMNAPVITNLGNNLTAHTTPDQYIYIADLSVDGNWKNRDLSAGSTASVNEAGCAIQLACVEHALIERVFATHGHHSIDISASMYRNEGTIAYADGPSRWVTVRDCVGGSSLDDVFTIHHSEFIRIEDCVSYQDDDPVADADRWTEGSDGIWSTVTHGFEVDDGSRDVQIMGCYSYGHAAGFQVKAHGNGPPPRRVSIEDCVADHTRIGFSVESYVTAADAGEQPEDYTPDADVRLIRCEARNLQITHPDDAGGQIASLRVIRYKDVHIEDFLVRDSPGAYMPFTRGAARITVDGFVSENSWTAPIYTTQGAVHVGDADGPFTFKNITIRQVPIPAPIITVAADQEVHIEKVTGPGSKATAHGVEFLGDYNPRSVTKNVSTSGYAADINIATGDFAGDWTEQVAGRETYGKAAPTTGRWNTGDRCWKIAPAAGTAAGWVCVATGTPGTWKTFATITA